MNINGTGVGASQDFQSLEALTSPTTTRPNGRFYCSSSTADANSFGNSSIYFYEYKAIGQKRIKIDSASATNNTNTVMRQLAGGIYSPTAAITSIALTPRSGAGNFAEHTTASLYGITKGSDGIATVS